MSNTKHTPGPWERIVYKTGERGFKIISGKKPWITQVAEASEIYMDRGERHANAKLIAAAPELLEALIEANRFVKALKTHLPDGDWKDAINAGVEKMEAIIKKATE